MDIDVVVSSFTGENCWSIVAGKGTGSVVHLGFGKKIEMCRPLTNPNLTEDERKYDPELSMMIFCAWRIMNPTRIICSWRDDNEKDGRMLSGLNMLRDKKVVKIGVNEVSSDLDIYFEDDLIMSLFCDVTNDYDGDYNYHIFTPDTIFTIGLDSKLEIEART